MLEHKSLWLPNPDSNDGIPNPQRLAIESEADELFYGGAAGGGKSDLLLGLGFTRHQRSVIFRRVYPNLKALIERSREIVGDRGQYNSTEKTWRLSGRTLEFGAIQYEQDKIKWQGQPHDYIAFDELPEISRTQYEFVIMWNRTTVPNQRVRVVGAGNPPTDEAGSWVVKAWAPWLDDEFEDPARPGELRWYHRDEEDRLVWTRTPDPIQVNGEVIHPRSRTFIPARLSDNPWLDRDPAYRSVLQSLPEPLRSQFLHGDFSASIETDPWQVIPTEWVREAQRRWIQQERPNIPISSAGLDVARGGKDKTALARRYDNWFDIIAWPGRDTRDGPTVAGLVHEQLQGEPGWLNVDVIGIGSSPYDSLKEMYGENTVNPINAGGGSKHFDRSGSLKMRNIRAEYYWRMREALDPDHGDALCLPPGNEVLADLCAGRFEYTVGGVKIELKEKIKARIGRSPDVGEAIMLANLPPPEDELEEVQAWTYG